MSAKDRLPRRKFGGRSDVSSFQALALRPETRKKSSGDDYHTTGEEMKLHLEPKQIADLEGRYVAGDGTLLS